MFAYAHLHVYQNALRLFDAWVLHPCHPERAAPIRQFFMLVWCLILPCAAVYALLHHQASGSLLSSDITISGLVVVILASVCTVRTHAFLFGPGGQCAIYRRAAAAQRQTDTGEALDGLFARRCVQMGNDRHLYHMCRVEWWLAHALWKEDTLPQLQQRYYGQALPPARAESPPRNRL